MPSDLLAKSRATVGRDDIHPPGEPNQTHFTAIKLLRRIASEKKNVGGGGVTRFSPSGKKQQSPGGRWRSFRSVWKRRFRPTVWRRRSFTTDLNNRSEAPSAVLVRSKVGQTAVNPSKGFERVSGNEAIREELHPQNTVNPRSERRFRVLTGTALFKSVSSSPPLVGTISRWRHCPVSRRTGLETRLPVGSFKIIQLH